MELRISKWKFPALSIAVALLALPALSHAAGIAGAGDLAASDTQNPAFGDDTGSTAAPLSSLIQNDMPPITAATSDSYRPADQIFADDGSAVQPVSSIGGCNVFIIGEELFVPAVTVTFAGNTNCGSTSMEAGTGESNDADNNSIDGTIETAVIELQ